MKTKTIGVIGVLGFLGFIVFVFAWIVFFIAAIFFKSCFVGVQISALMAAISGLVFAIFMGYYRYKTEILLDK